MNKTTKFELMSAFFSGLPIKLSITSPHGINRVAIIVNQIEREDGSGHCYNVTGHDSNGKSFTIFVRTTD